MTILVMLILVGLPLIFLGYQARHSGLGWSETIRRITRHSTDTTREISESGKERSGTKIDFLTQTPIGLKFTDPPLISHVQAADLDKDNLLDVIVCDDRGNFVSWIRQYPAGVFTEKILAGDIIAPAHVQVYDFDKDGDNDLIVGVLGMLFPNNDKIGSVVILENDGKIQF